MLETRGVVLESDEHGEDDLVVLDRGHLPIGEGLAVAVAVDVVLEGLLDVAAADEVCVQGVDGRVPARQGASRRDDALPEHLAAEGARGLLLGVLPDEQVVLASFDVEQVEEFAEILGHVGCHADHPMRSAAEEVRLVAASARGCVGSW
ncbi:Uncharacterised protein [Mycobacteroides abscessus subsp. abscessus]|nr:Uncharacterised protein [Mycobacteroides abscessus subsp. abscessus]